MIQVNEDEEEEKKRPSQGYQAPKQESSINQKRKEGCSCLFGKLP